MDPHLSQHHLQLAIAAYSNRDMSVTERECQAALDSNPLNADATELMGLAQFQLGRQLEGCRLVQLAINLSPREARYHSNMGLLLGSMGRVDEAIRAFENAVALHPNQPELLNNLAAALRRVGRNQHAIERLQEAIALRPDFAEALYNLGNALKEAHRCDEALEAYGRCLEVRPEFPQAVSNLGVVLKEMGRLSESIAACREALKIAPDPVTASNLICTLHYLPETTTEALFDAQLRWNQRYAVPLPAVVTRLTNDASPQRRLRIGYVSADFSDHPVGSCLLPVLRAHDRTEFEVHCYSDVRRPDAQTARLQSFADAWVDCASLTDEQLARQIVDDRIDILIDLAQHTNGNRLLTFARKPAPVQITWLGWPGTTGLATMDYRLSDPYLDTPGLPTGRSSEKTICLPDSFWCFAAPDGAPDINALPAMSTGHITFGCFNNFCKITDVTLELWRQVLEAVPDSRLILRAPSGSSRDRILNEMQISPDRIVFAGRQPAHDYFAAHHQIDIMLDTVPYGGHSTTFNSLWMGIPVVTLAGVLPAWRGGLSILSNLHLSELVAFHPHDYVQIAADLSNDLPRLATLRASMRDRLTTAPFMNAAKFTRGLEAVFRATWANWVRSVGSKADFDKIE